MSPFVTSTLTYWFGNSERRNVCARSLVSEWLTALGGVSRQGAAEQSSSAMLDGTVSAAAARGATRLTARSSKRRSINVLEDGPVNNIRVHEFGGALTAHGVGAGRHLSS